METKELLNAVAGRSKSAIESAIESLDRIDPEWKRGEDGRAFISMLRNSLFEENAVQRELSAWTLSLIRDEETLHYLLGIIDNGTWKHQVVASEVLGLIGDPRSVEPLIIELLEGMWPVPKAAAAALNKISSSWQGHVIVRAAVPKLIARLEAEKWFIRQRGLWVLNAIGDRDTFGAATQRLNDPAEEVRATAARIVSEFPPRQEALPISAPVMRLNEEDIPALIRALNSNIVSIKRRAVDALRQLGHASAIGPLIGMMSDPDRDTRVAVVRSLCELGWRPATRHERALFYINSGAWNEIASVGEDAVAALREVLPGLNAAERVNMVGTLVAIGGESAISALVALICDPKDEVRKKAIAALDSMGWQPRNDKEMTLLSIAWGIWEQAVAIGYATVPTLIDLLSTRNDEIQACAIRALGEMGDVRAVDPLINLLSSSDWRKRGLVEEALFLISGDTAREALIQLMGANDRYAKASATTLLGRLDHPEVIEPLIEALADPEVGRLASSALGRMQNTDVTGRLIMALASGNASERCLMMGALGQRGSREAVPVLVNVLLHDQVWQVRQYAADALAKIGWEPSQDLERIYFALALGKESELFALGVSAVSPLLDELGSGAFGRKTIAARVLGRIKDSRAVKGLIARLGDETEAEETRVAAVEALGEIGELDSRLPLFYIIRGINPRLAQKAITALDKIDQDWLNSPSIINELGALVRQLEDADPDIRARAAIVLGRFCEPKHMDRIALLLTDPDQNVRSAAKVALREIGRRYDIETMKIYLRSLDSERQGAVLEALKAGRVNLRIARNSYAAHSIDMASRVSGRVVEDKSKEPCAVTTYYPPEVEKRKWNTLIAYIYDGKYVREVEAEINSSLGETKVRMREMTAESRRALAEGSTITVTPSIPGFVFNPPKLKLSFHENWQRFDFRFMAEGARLNVASNGTLTIRTNGAIVAAVPLSIFVTTSPVKIGHARTRAAIFRAIFASYSHADTIVVERVERICRLLGMEYLRDTNSLKSGEMWKGRLSELIGQADIFQLFWSRNAAKSRWVREEVDYAIGLKRPNFIWPVYWEEPLPKVPKALEDIHFFFEPGLGR